METEVHEANDRSRYEITADGELAGFAEYLDVDGTRVFTHTEVLRSFAGQGLGRILVGEALDQVAAAGRSIVALCPFVDHVVSEEPTYAKLVDHKLDAKLRRD